MDDQDKPLEEYQGEGNAAAGNPETTGVVRAKGMSTPAKVILGSGVAAALAGAGWVFFKRFAAEGEDDDDDE